MNNVIKQSAYIYYKPLQDSRIWLIGAKSNTKQTAKNFQRSGQVLHQLAFSHFHHDVIRLDACTGDGSIFSDHEVRMALKKKGFEKVELGSNC